MKLSWSLFVLLLLMCLVTTAMLRLPEVTGGHGMKHAEYPQMNSSPDGVQRLPAASLWLAGTFGAASLLLMVGTLAWGLRKQERIGKWKWLLISGSVIYVAIFVGMLIVYRSSAVAGQTATLLSFPLPTAIMLFALWPWPLVFIVVYGAKFDRWVISPRELEQFQQIVQRRRQKEDA